MNLFEWQEQKHPNQVSWYTVDIVDDYKQNSKEGTRVFYERSTKNYRNGSH